jgi:hypothetical protein
MAVMDRIVIGVDPHKASWTAAVVDGALQPLDTVRVPVSAKGYRQLRQFADRWPGATWAIEGAGGLGATLLARPAADGLDAVDVPAKLAARVRLLSSGHGRKNDNADAISVGIAAMTAPQLQTVQASAANWPARSSPGVGAVGRFRSAAAFAAFNGTAPIEVSSGDVVRHRLSRAGDRQLNYCLHIMAITQIRHNTPGGAYYQRKRAAGKSHKEALRCLKRRLSDVIYRQLVTDAARRATSPGGQVGTATESSAPGSTPTAGSSDKSLPELVDPDPTALS